MFLLIDKPKGITSHDVVARVRKVTGERKVGHAGTLDPNATGLLIVGIGRQSTKKLGGLAKDTTKTYEGEVVLGEERDTDDAQGRKLQAPSINLQTDTKPSKSQVGNVVNSFIGKQKQVPPAYSALKIKGKKAYDLARKGIVPQLEPRSITVHSIKLVSYDYPKLNIHCEVSAGTYIRSLARDIGKALAVGAYLNNLRRTNIGKFSVQNATSLDKLTKENWEKFAVNL